MLGTRRPIATASSGWVQLVTTILKFVPLALIGLIGLAWVQTDNLTPFAPDSGGDSHIGAAATLALWAFIPVYVWMKWRQKRDTPEIAVPDYPPEKAERPLVIH